MAKVELRECMILSTSSRRSLPRRLEGRAQVGEQQPVARRTAQEAEVFEPTLSAARARHPQPSPWWPLASDRLPETRLVRGRCLYKRAAEGIVAAGASQLHHTGQTAQIRGAWRGDSARETSVRAVLGSIRCLERWA
jgi:hypothetical protein